MKFHVMNRTIYNLTIKLGLPPLWFWDRVCTHFFSFRFEYSPQHSVIFVYGDRPSCTSIQNN